MSAGGRSSVPHHSGLDQAGGLLDEVRTQDGRWGPPMDGDTRKRHFLQGSLRRPWLRRSVSRPELTASARLGLPRGRSCQCPRLTIPRRTDTVARCSPALVVWTLPYGMYQGDLPPTIRHGKQHS
jgi:hypothetical protein